MKRFIIPAMEKVNEFSFVKPRLDQARRALLPLFPTKKELIAQGLKEMVFPHQEKDWYSVIIQEGRQLGEIAGLWPFEQDIMTIWFFKNLQKKAYDYKKQMGFEVGRPKFDTDEQIVLVLVDAIDGLAGTPSMGEENTAIRSWIFGLKEMGDGLAKRIVSSDFSIDDTVTFMREQLRSSIGKRVPFQDMISPYLDLRTNLTS